MSKDIYSIQRTLNEILDIEPEEYTIPDSELFDCSDYPNDGKGGGLYSGQWFDCTGMKHTEETKLQMSISHTGKKQGKHTEEHRKAISEAHKGKKHSEEHKRANSKGLMGNQNAKGSKSRTGMKNSEESKRILSIKMKGNQNAKGHKPSKEAIRKRVETFKKTMARKRKQND